MEKVYIKEKKKCSTMDKYLKPEFVYLPINNINYSKGDYIYKNTLITNNIYSPISGYFMGTVYKYINGIKTKCMIIENDYKEKYKMINYIFDKDIFIDSLKINNLIDEYDNYDIKYLVINAIDIEPYIFSKRVYINNTTNDILDIINNLINKLSISKAIISIVDNYYPVSNNRILFKELFGYTYNKTSLEKKVWIIDLLSLINIDSIMKNNIPKNETIITIGGSYIRNSVMRVKIGTSFKEIIKYLGDYKNSDIVITIGGTLSGKQIINDDFIIMDNINSIFITKKRVVIEKECTLCSRCNSVCPVNLVPVFIMKNINNKNNLRKLNIDKCLECNLCSYICPSGIDLKSYIDRAKEVIDNE